MAQCCPPSGDTPGCGHWYCPDCDLLWDEAFDGGFPEPTQAEFEQMAKDIGGSSN